MTSTLDSTSINLGNQAEFEATAGPNNLTFQGNVGGDVVLTGIDYFLFDGEVNTGTSALGGHCMSFVGERATNAAAGISFSVGAGTTNMGPVTPAAGRVTSLNWAGNTSSTCTIQVIGSVSGTLISLSIAAATSGVVDGSGSFVANEKLLCQVTSGTASGISRVFWTILFD